MTATTETLYLNNCESPTSVEDLAHEVQELISEMNDPSTLLHEVMYGEHGIAPTPLLEADRPVGGHRVLLKNETNHNVRLDDGTAHVIEAFKRRGALAAVFCALRNNPSISEVITASAGNHGLGVTAAARQLGLRTTVHTAASVSPVKKNKLLELGAVVNDTHTSLAAAITTAEHETFNNPNAAFIHAFDQVEVIAGQATVGYEMLKDMQNRAQNDELSLHSDPITIALPVGGGGLAAGVALVFKQAREQGIIGANVHILAAEVEAKESNTWSDGTATSTGYLPSLVLNEPEYVQITEKVSNYELAEAMHVLTGIYNKRIEPAGALAYAATLKQARQKATNNGHAKTTFIVPVTGANVSPENYAISTEYRREQYEQTLRGIASLATHHTFSKRTFDASLPRRIHIADGYHA